jgi:hypothetical protein
MKQRTYLNATITEIEEALSRALPVSQDLAILITAHFQRRYLQPLQDRIEDLEKAVEDAYHEGFTDGFKDGFLDRNPNQKENPDE